MNARGPEIIRALAPAFAVIVTGTIVTRIVLPGDAPPFAVTLRSVHRWWYLGRASGFVAYVLLIGSMLLGIGISSRVFDGLLVRPWVFEMHKFLSFVVLVAIAFHALVLLPDPYAHFNLSELLVPFASPYRPLATASGTIALYGMLAVAFSYSTKCWIGQSGWRTLHYASFALFAAALVHGVTAGADSGAAPVQVWYLASGLAVVFVTFFRILSARSHRRSAGQPFN